MSWAITFGEHRWRSDEVTVAQAVVVCSLLEDPAWATATPTTGVPVAAAWLAVLLAGVTGDPVPVTLAQVNALPLEVLAAAVGGINGDPD